MKKRVRTYAILIAAFVIATLYSAFSLSSEPPVLSAASGNEIGHYESGLQPVSVHNELTGVSGQIADFAIMISYYNGTFVKDSPRGLNIYIAKNGSYAHDSPYISASVSNVKWNAREITTTHVSGGEFNATLGNNGVFPLRETSLFKGKLLVFSYGISAPFSAVTAAYNVTITVYITPHLIVGPYHFDGPSLEINETFQQNLSNGVL